MRSLLFNHVAMQFLSYSGWLPGCCYAVSRVFLVVARVVICSFHGILGGCQGVAMQFHGILGGCQGVAMQFLGYSGWLPGCCYAVSRVFWVVAKVLISSFMCSLLFTMFIYSVYDILGGCQGVAMQFI